MNLMMDVIEYARLDYIAHTLHGFASALREFEATYGRKPFEWRVGRDVMRDLMRDTGEYGPAMRPDHEGRFTVVGVEIKLLPESYPDDAIMAVHKAETHAMQPRRLS